MIQPIAPVKARDAFTDTLSFCETVQQFNPKEMKSPFVISTKYGTHIGNPVSGRPVLIYSLETANEIAKRYNNLFKGCNAIVVSCNERAAKTIRAERLTVELAEWLLK